MLHVAKLHLYPHFFRFQFRKTNSNWRRIVWFFLIAWAFILLFESLEYSVSFGSIYQLASTLDRFSSMDTTVSMFVSVRG